jgi:hypothetical protein
MIATIAPTIPMIALPSQWSSSLIIQTHIRQWSTLVESSIQ